MTWTPDRLADAIGAVERGENINTKRLALLLELDLIRAGKQFVQEAIKRDEEADARLETRLAAEWSARGR